MQNNASDLCFYICLLLLIVIIWKKSSQIDKSLVLKIVEGELTGWGRLLKEMLETRSLQTVMGGDEGWEQVEEAC